MITWNVRLLKEHIENNGLDRSLLAVVDSIGGVSSLFSYHLQTARDAFQGIVATGASFSNIKYAFGISNQQSDFERARVVNEANIIACIQAARNIFDMFATLVNGVVLHSAIPEKTCNIHQVHDKLDSGELKNLIASLKNS